jgi:hypothetical protein
MLHWKWVTWLFQGQQRSTSKEVLLKTIKMNVVIFGGCGPRDLNSSRVGSIHEQRVTTITNIAYSVMSHMSWWLKWTNTMTVMMLLLYWCIMLQLKPIRNAHSLNIALDLYMSPVTVSCSHLWHKSSLIEGSSSFTKLFSVILQPCCVANLT